MKNFILGIGAQKAGTTWLHGYIAASPHYRTGRVREKEMHIWDANEIPEQAATRKTLLQLRRVSHYYAWRMRRSPDFYFDYFAKLLAGGGIAADITPSYSGLSGETLASIRDGITARGMDFRGVFLMRDPVGRCVSGFNMNRTRRMGGQASAEGVTHMSNPTIAGSAPATRTCWPGPMRSSRKTSSSRPSTRKCSIPRR